MVAFWGCLVLYGILNGTAGIASSRDGPERRAGSGPTVTLDYEAHDIKLSIVTLKGTRL